ncbi:hypothetical protein LIN78_05140 [Leeia sp. TBRC 13508]|uniref:Uncharacterized protein n=1 Tax=Leeia speluncae TaxID=2884804 RepID=A0ABS8D442_9NEIS|nr:hypothetical protein [Leeia speluncae]MCB6182931.1 hypothetical protein [Leeia speluncae]
MSYLSFEDAESESHYPLIYCIVFAFPATDRAQIDYYIDSVFNFGGAGGDPAWHISRFTDDAGRTMYSAEYETFITGVETQYGEYDEATVKRYVLKAMRKYARLHPEAATHIEQLIQQYQLE